MVRFRVLHFIFNCNIIKLLIEVSQKKKHFRLPIKKIVDSRGSMTVDILFTQPHTILFAVLHNTMTFALEIDTRLNGRIIPAHAKIYGNGGDRPRNRHWQEIVLFAISSGFDVSSPFSPSMFL